MLFPGQNGRRISIGIGQIEQAVRKKFSQSVSLHAYNMHTICRLIPRRISKNRLVHSIADGLENTDTRRT